MGRKNKNAYLVIEKDGDCFTSVFASRLRSRMEEQKESQTSLAKIVGVQRQTISLYATGQHNPNAYVLAKIARALNVSSDWLLGLSDYKSAADFVDERTQFLCDRRKCKICFQSCSHTSDISHAKNFRLVGSTFVEGGAAE